jgi:hypothetical protein
MHNQKPQDLGFNRTGVKMSPMKFPKQLQGAASMTYPPSGSEEALAENRIRFMPEAEAVGSVPITASLKGAF